MGEMEQKNKYKYNINLYKNRSKKERVKDGK